MSGGSGASSWRSIRGSIGSRPWSESAIAGPMAAEAPPPLGVRIGRLRSLRVRTMVVAIAALFAPLLVAALARRTFGAPADLLPPIALSLLPVLGLGWW